MIITKIEVQKKNPKRVSVYIDGSFAFGVDSDVAYIYGLKEGIEISKEWIDFVVKKEEQLRAKNYALTLLSYRARTEKEIVERMRKKGYEQSDIEEVVNYLKQEGYINDKTFAEMYIKDKSEIHKYGQNRIKTELYKKGISKELVNNLIKKILNSDEEYEKAKELAMKKIKSYHKDSKQAQYRKLSGFLARKGYSYDVISKVLKEIINEWEDNDFFDNIL